MNTYIVDEKVTVWRRTWYTTELSKEDFIKAVEREEVECDTSEIIYETEDRMTPEENDGQETFEVFEGNLSNKIHSNV